MTPFEERILQRLKTYREKIGLTQTELGEKLDLHKNQIIRYEKGESKLTLETLERWAKALNVPLIDVLYPGEMAPIVQLPPSEEEIEKRVIEVLSEWQNFRRSVKAKAEAIRKRKQNESDGKGSK